MMFALGAVGSILVVSGVAFGAGTPSTATFDGAPAAPAPMAGLPGGAALSNFDVQVHSRDTNTWSQLESMQAQHGPDCSAPPATHSTNSYEGAVFQCKDHVMTAITADGYGVIYLTPNQLIDISAGGTVSFEISTERMSTRDWWDIWITPYADNLALPFEGDVDLAGSPRNAVHIGINNAEGAPILTTYVNGSGSQQTPFYPSTLEGIVAGTNQAAVRQTMKLTLSPTRVKFERLASTTATALVFFDRTIPALSWSQGVVQFGHHSYNPTKDGSGVPATWHWDNFTLTPAVPFTIIKADRRSVNSPTQTVTFAAPAPANAMLRFSAIGRVEVSFDGGPFTLAQRQFASRNGNNPEHFSSYWTPMPAAARTVALRFTGDGWYSGGPYWAKDFAIFASGSASGTTPTVTTATPTTAATNTPTAAPTTSTATPTTPAATPTASPATPSPVATATATASPSPTTTTWTLSASTSSPEVARGGTMKVRASVKSSAAAKALVDVEIYSPSGKKVYQKVFDNRSFTAGQTRNFDLAYTVPATGEVGTYTVKIGVFKPSWGAMYAWNESAVQLTVR
jgi:hypothetical protein